MRSAARGCGQTLRKRERIAKRRAMLARVSDEKLRCQRFEIEMINLLAVFLMRCKCAPISLKLTDCGKRDADFDGIII